MAHTLTEAGQQLLSLCNPRLQIGPSTPAARPPPRLGLRQLSLQALQHQPFLVTVAAGAFYGGARDRKLKLQRTLHLNPRLLHPAEQLVGVGGPHLLGEVGLQRDRRRRRSSFLTRQRFGVATGPVHARPRRLAGSC